MYPIQNNSRFEKEDIQRLFKVLVILPRYVCELGTTSTGVEALLILLRRLTYPNRLSDLTKLFGRSKTELSLIFNTVSLKFVIIIINDYEYFALV